MLNEPDEALLDALRAVAPHDVPGPAHLTEGRGLYEGRGAILMRPGSAREVAEIVRLCAGARVGIVPWGGGTGLVGGQVKPEGPAPVLVSLGRMNAIREVDAAGATLTAEAGATLASLHAAAEGAGLMFPLSYASEGTATIGGALAVNSGGLQAVRYGIARDLCLGLEVVTPEGAVWDGLSVLRKDNTGYSLRDLHIGAEGTLGLITAAVVRLVPRPGARVAAWLALPSAEAAVRLLGALQAASGGAVAVFELMAEIAVGFGVGHLPGARRPVEADAPWHVLTELWGPEAAPLDAALERVAGEALERGDVLDAVIAQTEGQRADFRALRESLSDAQRDHGGSIKHDISVPVAAIPAFLAEADAAVARVVPGARPCPFGHLGDGNLHYNVTQPAGADTAAYLAHWGAMNEAVHDVVARHRGSFSAEHGIGRLKRDELARRADPAKLSAMRAIKAALDPHGIMNPGAVLRTGEGG